MKTSLTDALHELASAALHRGDPLPVIWTDAISAAMLRDMIDADIGFGFSSYNPGFPDCVATLGGVKIRVTERRVPPTPVQEPKEVVIDRGASFDWQQAPPLTSKQVRKLLRPRLTWARFISYLVLTAGVSYCLTVGYFWWQTGTLP